MLFSQILTISLEEAKVPSSKMIIKIEQIFNLKELFFVILSLNQKKFITPTNKFKKPVNIELSNTPKNGIKTKG